MIITEQHLRLPLHTKYPPYHVGDYLEEYFYKKFSSDLNFISRNYIGIYWTGLYCSENRHLIQPFLDQLDPSQKYFTVSQHDDAPGDRLPADTICFSAGGNIQGNNIIPIPLICSPININFEDTHKRPILASFVGSATHPIRIDMFNKLKNSKNIQLYIKNWTLDVTNEHYQTFIDSSLNSKFCLCPRGYGLNSFRLYEAMQLGCIPVIITDNFYLPWSDELDWNTFSVLVHTSELDNIEDILLTYTDDKIKEMKNNIKSIYNDYFTMNGLYSNILKRLQND